MCERKRDVSEKKKNLANHKYAQGETLVCQCESLGLVVLVNVIWA